MSSEGCQGGLLDTGGVACLVAYDSDELALLEFG